MKVLRRTILAVVLLVGVVLVLSMGSCRKEGGASKVRLSTSKNVWCSLPLIAKNRDYFKEEGLDVSVYYTDGGRYCMDAVISDSADLGTIVETNVSYLAYTGNPDIVVVGNVVRSTSIAVVARKSSGIEKVEDLVGKRLGFVPAMQGEIFANRLLKKHGISLDSVEIRKMQPKAIPPSLVAGEIDAASTWEPFIHSCVRALGDDAIVFRDPEVHKGYMHLAARPEWARKNPNTVQAFLRALKKAEEFARDHTQEAQALLSKEMNVDLSIVEAIWPHFEIGLTFDHDEILGAIVAEGVWIEETQKNFKGKPLPDYSVYVDTSYFDAVYNRN